MPHDLILASQWPAPVNARLAQCLPEARIVPIERGTPVALPPEASVLLASPMTLPGLHASAERPPGWPWGLRWVQLMSSGIDPYPGWLFDLPVATARGSAAQAIAEFVLAALFAQAKQLPDVWIDRPVDWEHTPRPVLAPLRGTTLGLVGFGAIGRAVAEKALALGLRVQVVRGSARPLELPGAETAASVASLFASSDHVVLAAPLTDGTRGLVSAAVLAQARPGLHLVNIARGGLVDHAALAAALDSGRLGRATLDVTEPEPLPAGHPFYTHPRVRLTPHICGASPDLFDNVQALFLDNLAAWRSDAPLKNLIEPKELTR